MNLANVIKVYKIGIITGAIVSFYGFMQINGRDFVKWNNPYNAMIGTLGNPNFASAVIALLVLVGFYGIFLKKLPKHYKYISGFLFLFGMVSIVVSDSRQGLFVILFSLFFYVSVYTLIKNKKIGFIVILLSTIFSIFVILGMLQKGPLSSFVYKQSVSVRGYYWRAGLEMFKDSPVFGVGMDRYGAFFKQFREVGYPLQNGYELSSSNAHNTFIQIFATAGFFAGVFYLALVAYVLFYGMKILKNLESENQKLVLGLLSVWIGFHAQSLISIDNLGVSIWGWVLGGTIIGVVTNLDKDNLGLKMKAGSAKSNKRVKINILQPTVSVVAVITFSLVAIPIYNMERNLFALMNISNPAFPQNKELVLIKAEELIKNKLADPFYKYRAVISLHEMGYTDRAHEYFEELYRTDPKNPDFLKGKIFFDSALSDSNEVINTRLILSEVDPWNAANYLELLILYKANNDLRNAVLMKNEIISFAPKSELAYKAIEILG
jgi:tetratricopeptide (TPR) repeat protein